MTIRFASGGSHFGFLLVDLAYFIQAVTVRSFSNRNVNFAKPIFGVAEISVLRVIRSPIIAPIRDSLLGELSDAENLDQGGHCCRDFCRESRPSVVVFLENPMWLGRVVGPVAGNASAASFRRIDLQTTADHLGSVPHDVMTEAVFQFRINRKSDAVVSYPP